MAFGLGKRECIGEALGRHRMFLFIVTLLQNFDIQTVVGALATSDSRQYPLQLIIHPPDYKISLRERPAN